MREEKNTAAVIGARRRDGTVKDTGLFKLLHGM
jgi:hypothetical protein